MRLIEPLLGVKLIAQGHLILHLVFFITSLFIQIKIWSNHDDNYLNPTAFYEETCDSYHIQKCYEESLHQINKNDNTVNQNCTCGFKDYFQKQVWFHLGSFALESIHLLLKRKSYYKTALIPAMVSSYILNIGILFYALVLKGLDEQNFKNEQSIYSLWMKIEVYCFYNLVFISIIVIFFAYFTKFRGYWIKKFKLEDRDDFLDKKTDDFLEIIKHEHMHVVMTAFSLLFTLYMIIDKRQIFLNDQDSEYDKMILWIQIVLIITKIGPLIFIVFYIKFIEKISTISKWIYLIILASILLFLIGCFNKFYDRLTYQYQVCLFLEIMFFACLNILNLYLFEKIAKLKTNLKEKYDSKKETYYVKINPKNNEIIIQSLKLPSTDPNLKLENQKQESKQQFNFPLELQMGKKISQTQEIKKINKLEELVMSDDKQQLSQSYQQSQQQEILYKLVLIKFDSKISYPESQEKFQPEQLENFQPDFEDPQTLENIKELKRQNKNIFQQISKDHVSNEVQEMKQGDLVKQDEKFIMQKQISSKQKERLDLNNTESSNLNSEYISPLIVNKHEEENQKLSIKDNQVFKKDFQVGKIWKSIDDKTELHFHEDFYSMSMLCLIKSNIDKYEIKNRKLSKVLYYLILIFLTSNAMLLGMCIDIIKPESVYIIFSANTYRLQLVRFASSIALHLDLSHEIEKGMIIMKYVSNHPQNFVSDHPKKFNALTLAFLIGFMQFFTSIFAELINIWMLGHQKTIENCIIHFVALEVVIKIPLQYFEHIHKDKQLFEIFKCHLDYKNEYKNKTKKRTIENKIHRFIYKFLRGLYVSIFFYFVPFLVVIVNSYYSNIIPSGQDH